LSIVAVLEATFSLFDASSALLVSPLNAAGLVDYLLASRSTPTTLAGGTNLTSVSAGPTLLAVLILAFTALDVGTEYISLSYHSSLTSRTGLGVSHLHDIVLHNDSSRVGISNN
jgi:hypothetical protein